MPLVASNQYEKYGSYTGSFSGSFTGSLEGGSSYMIVSGGVVAKVDVNNPVFSVYSSSVYSLKINSNKGIEVGSGTSASGEFSLASGELSTTIGPYSC